MFANKNRNRLNSDATPTLFPTMEGGSGFSAINIDHPYSRPALVCQGLGTPEHLSRQLYSEEPPKKICVLQDIIISQAGMFLICFSILKLYKHCHRT